VTSRPWTDRIDTVLVDVDGTLVDSNYQHALAWYRAFRRVDITLPVWAIHRTIGMGGDQLVAHLTDDAVEREHGDTLRDAWQEEFEPMLDEIRPLPDAHELLAAVKGAGYTLVLASSGPTKHVEHFLDLVQGRGLVDDWTSADDAEHSKPAPDLIEVALSKVGGSPRPVMVGDSTWDCVAARRADVPSLAVRTGGFATDELRDAGAEQVAHDLAELAAILSGAHTAQEDG
jgi:HAD superfamily hydrolase (TIGR01549 family)